MANLATRKRLRHFDAACQRLGTNDTERGQKIGVSRRGIQGWRYGQVPKALRALMEHPELLEALARDAKEIIADRDVYGDAGPWPPLARTGT